MIRSLLFINDKHTTLPIKVLGIKKLYRLWYSSGEGNFIGSHKFLTRKCVKMYIMNKYAKND